MTDYFISYTAADEKWAEWIAWTLEAHGHKTVLQKWDFAAGSNFVLEMHKAATTAKRTIAVLSPDYPASRFGAAEWATAFSTDPDSVKRILVPVRVCETVVDGLLKSIVYIDLVGLDEKAAERRLLDGLKGARGKPVERPSFPGVAAAPHTFPGAGRPVPTVGTRQGYMPKIRGSITDLDRRRFMREAFTTIQQRFTASLAELVRRNEGVEFDLTPIDAAKFTVEVFIAGKSRAQCRIWMGGLIGGDEIAYGEGTMSHRSNSINEALTLSDVEGELSLSTMMGTFSGSAGDGLDLKRLSPDEAAEYLWRRFSWNLEH
ncbi:MAG: toll/interleukin-1 receptor domain-containing protein [Alphaproteobacteria bacterium]|nr:toll/interleukin-1 receptor domain-containing protein [Alphaproteobacteria bacterium]